MPDPEADQGEHHFAYSLLPHAGSWDERTIGAAYALNDPLIVANGNGGSAEPEGQKSPISNRQPLISIDRPNIVVETVKGAEDGNGLIVRFYESQRRRGQVALSTGFTPSEVWRTNLLEDNQDRLTVEGNRVNLFVKPYEIVTLRLVPA